MDKVLKKPYEGDKPYLFVSYCHKDEGTVLPALQFLQDNGIRLWYDTGIDPGDEWPEVIANHLDKSSVFLAFVSQQSSESHNCRREFNFAIMKNMPFLMVVLESVEFTPVMKLQMGSVQAINYYEHTAEEFKNILIKTSALSACREPGYEKMFYLRCLRTSQRVLISHSEFKVGRAKELCDFAFEDNPTVSRIHALFDIADGICSVRDNNSLNHVYVNDKEIPLDQSCTLRQGDLIELGSESFKVEIEGIGGVDP